MSALAKNALAWGGARAAAPLGESGLGRRALLRAVPYALERMFDPEAAAGLDETFELVLTDPSGCRGGRFALRIADGRLTVERGAAPAARARVRMAADDVVRLAGGSVGWPALLADGRLQMSGDPFLALRFPNLFRLSPD